MDGVQSPKFRGQGLCGAIENQGIHFNQRERIEQLQDDGAPAADFCVGESGPQPQTVQGPETFDSASALVPPRSIWRHSGSASAWPSATRNRMDVST